MIDSGKLLPVLKSFVVALFEAKIERATHTHVQKVPVLTRDNILEQVDAIRRVGATMTGAVFKRSRNVDEYVEGMEWFAQEVLPAPAATAAKPAAVAAPNGPEIQFQIKALPDTNRIEGILCQRVAAEMRARYYQSGTKTLRKENRYLYQAWIAKEFSGYQDIVRFQNLQAQKTSFPPLISGDLDQLKGIIDDYDQLEEKAASKELEGLVMESVLKVFVNTGKGEEQIFQLGRKIRNLSYSALPDSVFEVPKDLNQIKK